MTYNRPRSRTQTQTISPKPYKLVPFPKEKPQLQRPAGQQKYHENRYHGTLDLTLTVQTSLHVSTGAIALGTDVGQNSIALIKTMVRENEEKLIIPGSSFKGVVRSVYEAITRSCLCKVDRNYKQKIPRGYQECEINLPKKRTAVCPACRIFGALNWQGLVNFSDAKCQASGFRAGFMPSLYRPRPEERQEYFKNGIVTGRKFYYHFSKAVDRGQQQGIPVQQASGKEYVFSAKLHLKNLSKAELGTLFIVLGQDAKNQIALKVGGGKPIGMGTMTVTVDRFHCPEKIGDRYLDYHSTLEPLAGKELEKLIQSAIDTARKDLVQSQQLTEIAEVLKYPSDRQPPEGVY